MVCGGEGGGDGATVTGFTESPTAYVTVENACRFLDNGGG